MDVELESEEKALPAMQSGLAYLRRLSAGDRLPDKGRDLEEAIVNLEQSEVKTDWKGCVKSLFSDRTKAEKGIVKQLLSEIVSREQIRQGALGQIEEEICQCETWLHDIRAVADQEKYLPPEEGMRFHERRTKLDLKVLELQERQREAELSAWQDLSTLRRYLLFGLRDYWSAARRSQVLGFGEDEDETPIG